PPKLTITALQQLDLQLLQKWAVDLMEHSVSREKPTCAKFCGTKTFVQYGLYYCVGNSKLACPSLRGSDAPELTPGAKSLRTAAPPPIPLEKGPRKSIL